MSISIHTNLMAGNAARTLGSHYNRLSKSVQRLSSGLRINSAADDAAGLAIRELMRADVASLNQGIRNANDAISLIQTADGALAVIDEKLIRMKELAEQAATGTYNSTQRLIINSEFQAMADEIDRIANATDFNGIKLLDGSLSGAHDGSGPVSSGAVKVHFGAGNDSAEDYYYIECASATVGALFAGVAGDAGMDVNMTTNDNHAPGNEKNVFMGPEGQPLLTLQQVVSSPGVWCVGLPHDYDPYDPDKAVEDNFMFVIPKGTKNFIINIQGMPGLGLQGDNDIQLFTTSGVHLAGTPRDDNVYNPWGTGDVFDDQKILDRLGFAKNDYDGSRLSSGPANYDGTTLNKSTYNGMTIGYTGDADRYDAVPNDGMAQTWEDYETLTIDEVTEDLILWLPGQASASFKVNWFTDTDMGRPSVETQEKAQQALGKIDDAIVKKDSIRAHLGALQNRLENTVTNLSIQAENLQASESRISDTDVATEMTALVRNQILTQSATAMLSQANSLPRMLAGLLGG